MSSSLFRTKGKDAPAFVPSAVAGRLRSLQLKRYGWVYPLVLIIGGLFIAITSFLPPQVTVIVWGTLIVLVGSVYPLWSKMPARKTMAMLLFLVTALTVVLDFIYPDKTFTWMALFLVLTVLGIFIAQIIRGADSNRRLESTIVMISIAVSMYMAFFWVLLEEDYVGFHAVTYMGLAIIGASLILFIPFNSVGHRWLIVRNILLIVTATVVMCLGAFLDDRLSWPRSIMTGFVIGLMIAVWERLAFRTLRLAKKVHKNPSRTKDSVAARFPSQPEYVPLEPAVQDDPDTIEHARQSKLALEEFSLDGVSSQIALAYGCILSIGVCAYFILAIIHPFKLNG